MPQTFVLPKQVGFIGGLVAPSSVLRFYRTGTSTPQSVYTDAALSNAVTSITADSAGVFAKVYLNPAAATDYRVTLESSAGVVSYTEDDISRFAASQSDIGAALYPKTADETAAGVTIVNYAYPPSNVLRYGNNTVPGTTDMTAAFNAALDVGGKVFVPAGTYLVTDIEVRSHMYIEGDGSETTESILKVGTNNAGAFRHSLAETVFFVTIKHLSIEAAAGVTGARAFLQDDKSIYTAYAHFDHISTSKNLAVAFDGFFITTRWSMCTDGYFGSPVGDHYFISSVPGSFLQSNQTNLCTVDGCRIFGATSGAPAAVDIGYGGRWTFCGGTDFEGLSTRAIRARAIMGGVVQDCWFENIDAPDYVITTAQDSGQSCGAWDISNNEMVLINLSGTGFISPSDALVTLRNNTCFNIPSGKVLVATSQLSSAKMENNRALSGLGSGTFVNKLQEGETGTFSLTLTGCTTSPTATARYTYSNGLVTLECGSVSGTSNATSCTLTTLPAAIRPASNKLDFFARISDNSTAAFGRIAIATSGIITVYKSATATGSDWTAAGSKSVNDFSVTYSLV